MAQLQAPYNFVTGDTVNAANLNAHTNGAVLLPGSITDQPDILLPAVTGKAFTSSGGLVATVTSTAHGLSNGDQLDVTASVAAFSGRQTITVTSVDTFTFTLASTAPAVASGTLDYTKVNLVASSDSISIYDQSAAALKESTFGQILNSGLSLNSGTATINTTVTSAINGKARSDINLTPNDGLIVTGKAFNSIDGITATVTSTAHGLETGMLLDVTASNSVYSGQHYITIVSVDTFSFVISQTTPVAASGTLDYTKKGTVKSNGNQYVSGKLNVAGNLSVNGTSKFTGNSSITGNLSVSGTSNFVGGFQVGGSTGYILTEIVEQTFTFAGATTISTWTNAYTSASYTKPAGEIWMVEVDFRYRHEQVLYMAIRFNQTSTSTTLDGTFNIEGSPVNYYHIENCILRYVFQNASTFTSTFTLDFQPSASGTSVFVGEPTFPYAGVFTGITMPASKFRIYKYKTL
jgi:hypothetical protein